MQSSGNLTFVEKIRYSESNAIEQASIDVMDAGVASASPRRLGIEIIRLPLPPIIRGPMFAFDCIVGGLIVASTVFVLFVPSSPKVTLSDIA